MSRAQQIEERARLLEAVAATARQMRVQLEGFRAEYAAANDLAMLLACATVSDQLDEWEAYDRRAATLRRRLGQPPKATPAAAGTGGEAAVTGR